MKKRLVSGRCSFLAPLLGLALAMGVADTALAQNLGACADPVSGACTLNQSAITCAANSGVYQGDGTAACRDCNCNGTDDAKEIQDCIDSCVSGGGSTAGCTSACSGAGTPPRPIGCDPSVAITTNSGNKCCNADSGVKTTIADAFTCTTDACLVGGSVSHVNDDAFCVSAFSAVTCTVLSCDPPNNTNVATGCKRVNTAAGLSGVNCDGADTGDGCDLADACDGSGVCNTNVAADGDSCSGVAVSGLCDLPDSCCSGVCKDIVASAGTECRAAVDACDVAETCTGGVPGCGFGNLENGAASKACPTDAFASAGTNCGNANNVPDICSKQDTCDGSGVCVNNLFPDGTPCRSAAGACDILDKCDGVSEACVDVLEAAGTVCRATSGNSAICDPEEVCTGSDAACPTDVINPGGSTSDPSTWVACETDSVECTRDVCGITSSFATCFHASGAGPVGKDGEACGSSDDTDCTDPDTCSGATCSANDEPGNTACGSADATDCNRADTCSGSGYAGVLGTGTGFCVNRVASSATVCRAAGAGSCNPADMCLGGAPAGDGFGGEATDPTQEACPPDAVASASVSSVCSLIGTFESHASPGPLTDSFVSGCFSIDIMVADGSAGQTGINCAFLDVTLGSLACPLTVVGVDVNTALFPDFNNFFEEPPDAVNDIGGCTQASGVGAGGGFVRLATIDVLAPQTECSAAVTLAQSDETGSSLIGQGLVNAFFDIPASSGSVAMNCFGDLYDVDGSNFVDAGDLSKFAVCWQKLATDAGCAGFDYDEDGFINGSDLSHFATAFDRPVCAGGVTIPCQQTNCGCPMGSTSLQIDEAGNVTPVSITPASNQMIESFGLTLPRVGTVDRVQRKMDHRRSR